MKAMLAAVALGTLVCGCATTIEAGPGYYRYDTHAAAVAPPTIVAEQPVVTYRQPTVVVGEPTIIYREPAVVYRGSTYWYHDHGK
jgi:hypothetical protein